ncbi:MULTISPECIES: tetratricopeptide repeat protein [Lacrimispora]|uniref:tetratricopeptide repeat protein n=1 Tax=Lacrimispora TaxID=2719231 RepID=UPI000BE23D69|nr:tetratricopeptide repeat protein [Lacrimispora amygdalina]MDK2967125.1 hypothetical protein [Lacrimispora sp.]
MSLILCRQEPVKRPFFFEYLGIRIFSSQELCYVIYNNPLLVMEGFIDESLLEFIREDLDMAFFAAKLEKWQKSDEEEDELLAMILHECDYYSASEVGQFRQKLASLRRLPQSELFKEKADFLFHKKQYGKAAALYLKILNMTKADRGSDAFTAKVYNNLGAAYARLFLMDKALSAYEKSYELSKSEEALKKICHLSQWNASVVPGERFLPLMTEELQKICREERELADEAAGKAQSLNELEQLFQKDPIKRFQGAGELVSKWKKEYRNIMS